MNIRPKFFKFGTKAQTLERMKNQLTRSKIPDFIYFTLDRWQHDKDGQLDQVQQKFRHDSVIVRSSAIAEDTETCAMAGMYHSELGVMADQRDHLSSAVDKIVQSYLKTGTPLSGADQVLVQRMVGDVSMSGVVFTQDMNTGAPYYVINYDDESGKTDTVTAGGAYSNRTLYVHRRGTKRLKSERFSSLLGAIREIEQISKNTSLDIEFIVNNHRQVFIVQVRKITTLPNWNRGLTLQLNDAVERVRDLVNERLKPMPMLPGDSTILGQMPDWNPVEMIGAAPKPLALSLYRYLITDSAWRKARSSMGYREPKGTHLMVSLAGQPYIDVKLSLNSMLPADLDPKIASKIVNNGLKRLSEHKELHDKIEFDITITAFTFDFETLVEKIMPGVLDKNEQEIFRSSLVKLTNGFFKGRSASIAQAMQKISLLKKQRDQLLHKGFFHTGALNSAAALLEDCVSLGTIPFSVLARHAFVAKSFVTAFINCQVLTKDEADQFLGSIRTVAMEMVEELARFNQGELDQKAFLEKYGHLRPGTYDIQSLRYDQRENILDRTRLSPMINTRKGEYEFTQKQKDRIELLLGKNGFADIGFDRLVDYIRTAVAGREYAKFVFTRNISDTLEIIANWGERHGLSREELSFLSISDILDADVEAKGRTLEQYLRKKSEISQKEHDITLALKLPHIIENENDVSIVPLLLQRPNFTTTKRVQKTSEFLNGYEDVDRDIQDKIVLIEGADPGFDWIFSRSPAGLVTKYGGVNSHMTIRCAEFSLPAAIGCGEQIFERLKQASRIDLNCSEGRIDPLEI